jgi:hypothetical protein
MSDSVKNAGKTEANYVIITWGKHQSYFGDGRNRLKDFLCEQKEILGTGNAASVAEPYVSDVFVHIYGICVFLTL